MSFLDRIPDSFLIYAPPLNVENAPLLCVAEFSISTWVLRLNESRAEPGQLRPVSAAELVDPGVNSEFTLHTKTLILAGLSGVFDQWGYYWHEFKVTAAAALHHSHLLSLKGIVFDPQKIQFRVSFKKKKRQEIQKTFFSENLYSAKWSLTLITREDLRPMLHSTVMIFPQLVLASPVPEFCLVFEKCLHHLAMPVCTASRYWIGCWPLANPCCERSIERDNHKLLVTYSHQSSLPNLGIFDIPAASWTTSHGPKNFSF